MISRFGLVTKRKGLSAAAFNEHWKQVQGPMAARLPGLRCYWQHAVVNSVSATRVARIGTYTAFRSRISMTWRRYWTR